MGKDSEYTASLACDYEGQLKVVVVAAPKGISVPEQHPTQPGVSGSDTVDVSAAPQQVPNLLDVDPRAIPRPNQFPNGAAKPSHQNDG
jgi:hypothetical protein